MPVTAFLTSGPVWRQRIEKGYIVVTADKGMAGAYNHNVIKIARRHPHRREREP